MRNLILIASITLWIFTGLFSQDIIELKSGERLKVSITKIGIEEIEFRNFGSGSESVVIKLDKYLVKSYLLDGQSEISLQQIHSLTTLNVEDLYDRNIKTIFKIQPLHFLRNDFKLAVEKSINYKSSYEIELGARKFKSPLISLSDNPNEQIYFNALARYKMYLRPSSVKMTDIGKNPMAGVYLAPFVAVGTSENNYNFNMNGSDFGFIGSSTNFYGTIGCDLGGQITTSNIVFDIFTGAGFSLNSNNTEFSRNTTHFSTGRLALRTGVRIGISDQLFNDAR
jgi:hypothetical protein